MGDAETKPPVTGIDPAILAEHRVIRETTRQLQEAGDLCQLLATLTDFRTLLVKHFVSEQEAGGFYDMVRSMAPRQIGRVAQLEKEHEALLADLDALADHARACLAGPVAEVFARARMLAGRLSGHEAAEDKILLDTIYIDLGQGD